MTAGSTTVTVADSTQFPASMPLIIAGAGAAGAALLTWVTATPTATTITVNDPAVTAITAQPIGAGNIWTPAGDIAAPGVPGGGGQILGYPTAHLPMLGGGPGLFLDPAQSIARAVTVTAAAAATGGAFFVRGYDVYWQPIEETITAVAASTVKGRRAFKAITSVTPQFTDAGHTYSVGTTDTFGFHYRSDFWEDTDLRFNAVQLGNTNGYTAAVSGTATAISGDVRGTIDVTNATGFNSASNGTLSGLAMTGRRLSITQRIRLASNVYGAQANPAPMYGSPQFFQ
jgi:hypothetical protein